MRKKYSLFLVLGVGLLFSGSSRLFGQSSVTLAWDPSPNSSVVGYVVYRGGASGSYSISTNVPNQTSASMTGLQAGQTYYFAVTARDSLGAESPRSNEVSYQVPVTTLPTIALTSPLNGATFTAPGLIAMAANVVANGHTITKVQFYTGATLLGEDTSSPYSLTWTGVSAGSYSLMARVVYDSGSTVDSTPANVTVANPSPTIALSSPTSGATYSAPANVNFAASVTANGHTITKVQFYNGTTLLGEDASSPYSFAWGNVGAGSYSLTARAVYDSGSTVDSTAASVSVTNPVGSGTVTVSNTAAITIVDGAAGAPYPSSINVSGLAGTISQLTVTLNNVSHTWPGDVDMLLVGPGGQKVMIFSDVGEGNILNNVSVTLSDGATTALPATAQIVSGTYQPTDLEVGDVLPAPAPVGPYATALSAFNGLSANGTWSLYVNDDGPGDAGTIAGGWSLAITTTGGVSNPPPTIALTAPLNGASYLAPATVSLAASVTANSHTITKVQFYNGATLLGEDTTSPYSFTWNSVGAGSYSVKARVVYDAGSILDSASASLTVTNPPPTIALTSPTSGASYTSPANIDLAASVTANGHTITKVQFYNGTTLLGEDASSPYSFTWGSVGAGSYSVKARVVYDAGSTLDSASASLTVTNPPTALPTIALTSPTSGASYSAPATISLAASVTANGHTITKVQFYNGATLLGEDTAAPYSLTWNSVAAGSYSVTAQVVYDAGSTATSAPANISVTTTQATVPGLVAAYSFNEGSGTNVTDSSGFGNNGTSGSAAWTTQGKYGSGLSFNGASRAIVPDSNSLRLTNGMTLEAWVCPTVQPTRWSTILLKEQNASLAYALYMDPTYKPSAYINIAGQQYAGGQFGIPLGSWTHLAATYDGTTLLFYVNGTQVGITIVSGNISAASGGLSIGGIGEEYFQGLIDEVRIYNRALSASEIQSDMNTPVTPVANPALPSPWLTANIGTVALTGAATESNGVYTVQGSGNLAGSADAFRFVYQPLSADGDITTRINSMTTNGVNRCVGVMVRESLAPNSKYAFMGIGQNLKFRWQRRSTTGGNTLSTTSVVATPPNAWARLVRSNSTLYGYSSTNGVNWTKLTSTSITMATNIYVGFVVASGSTNTLNTSVFSNVSVTP